MRVLVTGAGGVLGRALVPLLAAAGHHVDAPARRDLDLFDAAAVAEAIAPADAVYHLATRIRGLDRLDDRDAWRENDRLRSEASRILVDAVLTARTEAYIQPTVTFVYPPGDGVDEDTPIGAVPSYLESALDAERETARFAAAGRRGVVLRLGLLDGPGTGNDEPVHVFGATLDVRDAGEALLAALTTEAGTYNVVRDGERVSNRRFRDASGWRPRR